MQSEMTVLQISIILWILVTNIEVDQQLIVVNDGYSFESENSCGYSKCLFYAFNSVIYDAKRRYVNSVMDLVGRVDNFIEYDDFTEDELGGME